MNRTMLFSMLLATTGLAACESPTVVAVPATQVAVPGPTGATGAPGATGDQGAHGSQGYEGAQGNEGAQGTEGEKGDTGTGTTVIVEPAPPTE